MKSFPISFLLVCYSVRITIGYCVRVVVKLISASIVIDGSKVYAIF